MGDEEGYIMYEDFRLQVIIPSKNKKMKKLYTNKGAEIDEKHDAEDDTYEPVDNKYEAYKKSNSEEDPDMILAKWNADQERKREEEEEQRKKQEKKRIRQQEL